MYHGNYDKIKKYLTVTKCLCENVDLFWGTFCIEQYLQLLYRYNWRKMPRNNAQNALFITRYLIQLLFNVMDGHVVKSTPQFNRIDLFNSPVK